MRMRLEMVNFYFQKPVAIYIKLRAEMKPYFNNHHLYVTVPVIFEMKLFNGREESSFLCFWT